jgi:hypothetical protein
MSRSTASTGIGVVLVSLVLVLGLLLPALLAPQTTKAEGPDLYALVQIPNGQEATLKAAVDSVPDSAGVYAIVGCTQAQLNDLVANGYTVIEQCDVSDTQCLPQLTATLRSLIGSQSTFQLQGGPDTFGYKFIDSNEQGGPCFNWIDITQTGTNTGIHCDDCGSGFPMGFDFTFFGNTYPGVGIASNGYLGFSGNLGDYTNDCIPNVKTPNNIICPFWDDLISTCAGADIFYQTFGSAPNRYFVVEWVNNKFYNDCNSPSLTFEAILYEGSNSILFQYLNMAGSTRAHGDSATVGIENSAGTTGLQYSCNSATISNSLAILFYMPPLVDNFGCPATTEVKAPTKLKVSPSMPGNITPAQISLQYLNVNPQQASANQPVTISTNVVNNGDVASNYNVVLKINGQAEESRMVSLGPQTSQPMKFTVTRSQPGTYTVDVGLQKGSFIIIGKDSTGGKSANVGLIAILVLGVLMIVTVVSMLAFRRPA